MRYYAGLDPTKYTASVSKEAFTKYKFPFALLSYFYVSKLSEERINHMMAFYEDTELLLDSGAFSMITAYKKGKLKSFDLDGYVENYGAFVKKWRHRFKHFFELDIQPVVGDEEYARLRQKLIDIVGEEPTLVWHIFDPVEKFAEYCNKVGPGGFFAIGGVAAEQLTGSKEVCRLMRELVWYAKARDIHIHGLGITSKVARYIDFDSVDSFTYIKPVTTSKEFLAAYGYERGWQIACAIAKLNQLLWDTF